jgi:hypothetical protein
MTDLDNGADVRERFDRAMADLSAPEHLTQAVLADGHRLRRRRRVLTAATGTAAAAGVGVGALIIVSVLGGSGTSTQPGFATQPPAQTNGPSTAPPSDGPDPDPFPDFPAGWWDQPSDQLLQGLQQALPAGVTIQSSEPDPGDAGWLHATLSGPAGPGGLEIMLAMPDLEEIPDPVTTTDADGNEGIAMLSTGASNLSRVTCGHQARYAGTCEEILDAGGEPVGRLTSMLQDDTITFYEATLLGPRGGLVYISAWNATDEKPGPNTPPSSPIPPLTLDQLRDMVQDPAWTAYQP